tara:strand:+ start:298 stop:501 length:204 start_codon:yes stop_codon:yes gene_type:complete
MKIETLTLQDIREASSNYLRAVIKNGLDNPYVHDMIEKELYAREQTTFFDGKTGKEVPIEEVNNGSN